MKVKKYIWLIIMIIFVLFLVILTIIFRPNPPLESITNARLNLSKSEKLKSSKYSKDLYNQAKTNFDCAMKKWNKENEKFFFLRDYSLVEKYAEVSNSFSLSAIDQTIENTANMENNIGLRISKLKDQIDFINKYYSRLPYNELNTNQFAKCNLKLNEVIISEKQTDLIAAHRKLDSAEFIIGQLMGTYENLLQEYFQNYPKWKELVERTISDSRKNHSYSIIIDKYDHECLVFLNGELKEKYPVELGLNWIGDKNQQGDKSTPEGIYKVIESKENGRTKYYKALLLNYPNEDDKKRFKSNIEAGLISKDAKIGNLIEIHGDGGKNIDWTDGCIALSNSDMEKLFKICKPGTVVTIVGSVKPLHEIYNLKR